MAKPTQTITIGGREFQVPGRLKLGIVREHATAFVALAQISDFSIATVLTGASIGAMIEIVHAAVASIDPSISLADFTACVDDADFASGLAELSTAAGRLLAMKKRGDSGAGESDGSSSETSPVSTG